jgi:NitT/TauT family transport system substrate-binding protein
MRVFRVAAAGAALSVTALVTAACGGGSGSMSVTVGAPPVVGIGDFFTAESMHFFTKQGLKVGFKSLNGGAALVPALESGAVQIGQSNIVSVLQAQQHNIGMRCFAGAFRSPSGPQLALVVSPKKAGTITTAAGLAGQTIAVNTLNNANQLVAERYLQAHGVNPNSVHFMGLAYPDMTGALTSGRVAAAITDEPFTTQSVVEGAKVLSAQPDSEIAPHPMYACWLGSKSWLSSHKTVATKFAAALSEADSYMAAHPGYLASILPRYASVSAQLASKVTLPDFTASIDAADIQPWARAAAQFKLTAGLVAPSSILSK